MTNGTPGIATVMNILEEKSAKSGDWFSLSLEAARRAAINCDLKKGSPEAATRAGIVAEIDGIRTGVSRAGVLEVMDIVKRVDDLQFYSVSALRSELKAA